MPVRNDRPPPTPAAPPSRCARRSPSSLFASAYAAGVNVCACLLVCVEEDVRYEVIIFYEALLVCHRVQWGFGFDRDSPVRNISCLAMLAARRGGGGRWRQCHGAGGDGGAVWRAAVPLSIWPARCPLELAAVSCHIAPVALCFVSRDTRYAKSYAARQWYVRYLFYSPLYLLRSRRPAVLSQRPSETSRENAPQIPS